MPIYLRQSTASQEVTLGPFLDSTDGNTEETGLTIANTDILLHKAGATTLATKNSGGGTHISNGIYYAVLDATDSGTLGPMVIYCHPTGALATKVECVVLPAWLYDLMFSTTYSELAAVPAANANLGDGLKFLTMLARNKITQTATTQTLLADDGSTTVATSTLSNDGTTTTRGELT